MHKTEAISFTDGERIFIGHITQISCTVHTACAYRTPQATGANNLIKKIKTQINT